MNWGVVSPVKKEIPSGQPFDPLTNLVQISQLLVWVEERDGQAIVIVMNVEIERITV